VHAVVCRGGRPDLASSWLTEVVAPTLFLVGEEDRTVLMLNQGAQAHLHCPSKLSVIPGAGHNLDEPGALEEVSRQAVEWFGTHLRGGRGG
jgi:putative phosphoribosyl transferase